MKKTIERNFYFLLIFLIVGCNSQPMTETQQIASTPTVTPLPTATLQPISHPLAITVQNASSVKLQKTIGAGSVNDVAWSPQGDVIAVAQDFDILLYDSSSLQLINSIDLWGNRIAFSPNGLFLAIAHNNHITIWDIEKKEKSQEFEVEMERVHEILYNSTGDSLAVLGISRLTEGDPPSVLELWSTLSWKRIYINKEKNDPYMAFSPNGEVLAFTSYVDLLLINSDTGAQQKIDLTEEIGSLAYLSDDILLKRLNYIQLKIIDLRTLETLRLIDVDGSYSEFKVSPDKKKIVIPNVGETTQIWDLETGNLLFTIEFNCDATRLDFSPDNKFFVSADNDGYIRVHDLQTGEMVNQIEFTTDLDEVGFVSGDTLMGGYYSSQIKLWDIDNNKVNRRFNGYKYWGNIVSISPNQKMLAAIQDDYSGKIWEIETGFLLKTIACPDKKYLDRLLFDKNNNVLFECWNFDTSFIGLMDLTSNEQTILNSGSLLRREFYGNKPIMISKTNANLSFYVKDIPGIQVVDVFENNLLFDIHFKEDWYYLGISDMGASSDGELLALLVDNFAVLTWEAGNKEFRYSLQGHQSDSPYKITDIAFSPYGYLLASAGYDKTVRLWDVSTGEQLAILEDFVNAVNVVAFSPDGRYLIAGCDDGRIYVYAIE